MLECKDKNQGIFDANKLVEYNPSLVNINPAARIAYAKFKMRLFKQELDVANAPLVSSIKRRSSSLARRPSNVKEEEDSENAPENKAEKKPRRLSSTGILKQDTIHSETL